MPKKWSSEGPRKPHVNTEAQQSYRNHKKNSGSPLEKPDRWHLCCSKGLKRILLAQVKRRIVKVPTFKRRPQKRRNAGAPLCAHATTRNEVAPKHLTNCRLIEENEKGKVCDELTHKRTKPAHRVILPTHDRLSDAHSAICFRRNGYMVIEDDRRSRRTACDGLIPPSGCATDDGNIGGNRSMDCSGEATMDITSIWIMDW